jgi:hypothetical protein
LGDYQDPTRTPFFGERLALALLDQAPAKLKKTLDGLDDQGSADLVDSILAAEQSPRNRLKLVTTAFARIAIASGVDQAPGGANG